MPRRHRAAANLHVSPVENDKIVREAECEAITGLSRATRWRMERAGRFPKKRQLSPGCKGWLGSEIQVWIAERTA
jgi:prophage regulatory protein